MNEEDNNWHFETESVHSGLSYNEETGAVIPPIFATSTFESDNQYGFDYTRSGNPNFRNLEEVLKRMRMQNMRQFSQAEFLQSLRSCLH